MNSLIKIWAGKLLRKNLYAVGAILVATPFIAKAIAEGYITIDQLKQWADLTVDIVLGLALMAGTYLYPIVKEWLAKKKTTV